LELLSTAFKAVYVVARDRPASLIELAPGAVRASGYGDDEALLPVSAAVFQGYRLLQEYFAFPARFLSFEVQHLRAALAQVDASEFELVLLFGKGDAQLESLVDAAMFALFATPAVNLRPRRADRINVDAAHDEFHVVVDRTRPMDFEVHSLLELTGLSSSEGQTAFVPLYSAFHLESGDHAAYYTVRREQRLLSQTQRRQGPRSSYVGSEMFVSLVDPKQAPFSAELQQLAPRVLVTNRDLPLLMPVGQGASDFSLEVAAPVKSIRCIRGPSRPFAPLAEGALSWKLISHLSLNYLSLQDTDARQGAAALREMLRLYVAAAGPGATRQIDGVQSVVARPGVRRVPMSGPIAFARGTQIELTVDELAFQGGSAFLL
ncbi:MAG: type VI secretion system baseplate subunit TssF, partial [Betaproteobacteria bacterium]|nr:type VI secretion system baseplate subunit TssF [Betaproteobacteria bacterium]